MTDLESLLIERACRDLVLRAARHADNDEPERLAALFTTDGRLQRPDGSVLEGRDAIAAAYAQRAPGRLTRHLVVATQVEVVSAAQAHASSQVLLWIGSSDEPVGPRGRPVRSQVVGEFADRLALTADGWRLSRREARFIMHTG